MKLFGGPVAWKALKQTCVVTLSTEAELFALTAATWEFLAAICLLKQLRLLPGPYALRLTPALLALLALPATPAALPLGTVLLYRIYCDNWQTL